MADQYDSLVNPGSTVIRDESGTAIGVQGTPSRRKPLPAGSVTYGGLTGSATIPASVPPVTAGGLAGARATGSPIQATPPSGQNIVPAANATQRWMGAKSEVQKWQEDQQNLWQQQRAAGSNRFYSREEMLTTQRQRMQKLDALSSVQDNLKSEAARRQIGRKGGMRADDILKAYHSNEKAITALESSKWPWEL